VYRGMPFYLWETCGERRRGPDLWDFCEASGHTQLSLSPAAGERGHGGPGDRGEGPGARRAHPAAGVADPALPHVGFILPEPCSVPG
jgi:hypothetical protein